jgi:hypothetical protein
MTTNCQITGSFTTILTMSQTSEYSSKPVWFGVVKGIRAYVNSRGEAKSIDWVLFTTVNKDKSTSAKLCKEAVSSIKI